MEFAQEMQEKLLWIGKNILDFQRYGGLALWHEICNLLKLKPVQMSQKKRGIQYANDQSSNEDDGHVGWSL